MLGNTSWQSDVAKNKMVSWEKLWKLIACISYILLDKAEEKCIISNTPTVAVVPYWEKKM